MKQDKGQFVKKHNSDGSINESWLQIHEPDKSQKYKDQEREYRQAKKEGRIIDLGYASKGSSSPRH
jgi:hypothetical protein